MLNIQKHIQSFSPGFLPGIKPALYSAILVFTCSISATAQPNLVVNGDFEEYSSCPNGFSDPSQNPKEIEKCIGWKAPTYGTSDYYNTCSLNSNVSIPINGFGQQLPFNGDGYLGSYFTNYNFGDGTDGYSGIMWWEYVQGELITPLESGKLYKLSMEVSLAEYSDLMINEFGVYFSVSPISSPNTASLNVIPQCTFFESNYFRDTVNWVHLEMDFTASGGEQFLTIGNFNNDLTTDTMRRFDLSPGTNPYFTYFYIDNVMLIDPSAGIPVGNAFSPNGDGINDEWTFPFTGKAGESKITILNRWGNRIVEGDAKNFSWNGQTVDGKECSDGTYFYRVSNSKQAGFIQLVR